MESVQHPVHEKTDLVDVAVIFIAFSGPALALIKLFNSSFNQLS